MKIQNCVVLQGPELEPWKCASFEWSGDTIKNMELVEPVSSLDSGGLVIIPGLYNSHTHMGDSAFPDGATGLSLEQGFFRPNGFKYREIAKLSPEQHLPHLVNHLHYMARTGTVCHIDFREQGAYGSELLREASRRTGVNSIILGQFNEVPFDDEALASNKAGFSPESLKELGAILEVADGFSESTMNDLTDPGWQTLREITRSKAKLRAIHCLENTTYRDVSLQRTGRGDLIRALELYDPHLVIHLTVANAAEIELMAKAGKTGVMNPRANLNLGLPQPPLMALEEAGVNLLVGTDNGMLNSPNMFAELDFSYKLLKSQYADAIRPDPRVVLKWATSNIGKALGGDHYGYLARELPASFVVLDFNQPHLRSTRNIAASVVTRITPEDVLATYCRGQAIYRNPHFQPNLTHVKTKLPLCGGKRGSGHRYHGACCHFGNGAPAAHRQVRKWDVVFVSADFGRLPFDRALHQCVRLPVRFGRFTGYLC